MSHPIALSVCVLAISGTLATCEDEQAAARREAAEQLETAADKFRATAGVAAVPGGSNYADRHASLEQLLRDATSIPEAEGGPTGSKNVLVASIQRELAAMELAEAAALARDVEIDRETVHALLDAAQQRLDALAEGRRAIEVDASRVRLQNQREQALALAQSAGATAAELDTPITELTAEIEADRSEVDRLLEQANRLRAEAGQLGPARGFSRFEQAVNLEREADQREYAIARREIDLGYELQPARTLAQRGIEAAEAMLESIGRSEQSITQFLQLMRQDAQITDEQVRTLAGQINQRISTLQESLDGGEENLLALYDAAADRLDDAVQRAASAVRQLDGNDAAAARLAEARTHAQLGRTRWSKAANLLDQAVLLSRLASADDVIDDTGQYRTALESTTTRLDETWQQAREAYDAAQGSLEQVAFRGGNVGEANLALGAFKSAVDEAIASLSTDRTLPAPGEPAPSRPSVGAPRPAAPTPPSTPSAPPAAATAQVSGQGTMSPEALVRRLEQLGGGEGDTEAFLSLCYVSTEQNRVALDAVRTMAASMEQLEDAFEAQYGQRMSGMGGPAGSMDLVPPLQDATVEITGDGVAVCRYTSPLGQQDQMTFRRVDGRWYVDADELGNMGQVPPGQIEKMTAAIQSVARELAPQIRSGALGDAQAAEQAIAQRMMQAVMSAMGQ